MKLFFRPIKVVLLTGTFLAASISSVGVASPQASSQEDFRSPFETLSQIVQADSITIKDEWEGYGPFSPISAVWDLHRSQDGFSGTAPFGPTPTTPSIFHAPFLRERSLGTVQIFLSLLGM